MQRRIINSAVEYRWRDVLEALLPHCADPDYAEFVRQQLGFRCTR
jgi:hypothetical protein